MRPESSQLLLLLNWMSPAFPTGSFAYSHGLEWAIAKGDVKTTEEVTGWISDLLTQGSGWNDAVLFACCWDGDPMELNELALALAGSSERYLETTQLGRSFSIACDVFLPSPLAGEGGAERRMRGRLPRGTAPSSAPAGHLLPRGEKGDVAYPVAAGVAFAAIAIDRHHAALAYLQGFASALVSVAVRLVPLGQTAGLHVLKALMPVIAETASRATAATLDDLGSCTLGADLAAMHHETLEPRVFRT